MKNYVLVFKLGYGTRLTEDTHLRLSSVNVQDVNFAGLLRGCAFLTADKFYIS